MSSFSWVHRLLGRGPAPWLALACLGACATQSPNAPAKVSHRAERAERNDAAPRAQAQRQPASAHFALIGDFGYAGQKEQQVADLVHSWEPQFIVSLGDNNYPNGAEATIDANIGQYYGQYIAHKPGRPSPYPASAMQRFFPCLGNHDWRTPGALPYLNYFDLPGNGRYYRIAQGPVEFFMLDSDPHEPDGTDVGSVQAAWLQAALQESTAPWKLVVLHHPPFSSGRHGSNAWMQWPFKAWGADAVLGGHDHAYEHLVVDGLDYIVMGLSGAPKDKFKVACNLPQATTDTCYDDNYGALQADVDKQLLTLRFITIDGRTQDTVALRKKAK